MIKRVFKLFQIARKLSTSGAIDTINQVHQIPVSINLFFSFISILLFAGTFQGQWLRGLRHGYGVRTSAPFGMASHNKLSETRMASMSSLSQEVDAANVAATATAAAAALGTIHILRKHLSQGSQRFPNVS